MAILAAAINHVPENFLDRNTLIMNICKASPEFNTLTPETVMQFIPVFQRCHSLMKFYKDNEQDISTILWQASWHHKEPFLAFINPPVTECLQCEETLYPTARVPITLYHLTGPIPGQRGVLKCKSCQIYYHVDGYSVPNQGKSFYPAPITCPWKSASNRVFWSKDLHEFLCESSNHGFVSHQAFAEIFNSVYSDNHPESEKFHAWRNYMLKATRTAPEASPGIN
ncbi:uncharacterized protein LOC134254917 [Saccostrea cucullata]|uniref:uncharacterized protein LOC134254917 n=1 Tax=Saccostrea cuccullata TaxID=36930 RepID=UPI002ED233A5